MKKITIVFLAIFLLISIPACTVQKSDGNIGTEEKQQTENNERNFEVEESKKENLTVTDHLGSKVTLEEPAQRIVSGYYITTSALISLGLEDKIIGLEAKADTRPIYSLAAPKLLNLPNVGTAKQFDLEGCIELNPDLVILPIKLKDQIKTLKELGIKVIGVNPEDKELLFETIEMIGKLTGVESYENIISYYKEKEDEIVKIHENLTNKPRVYLAGNSSMLSTATAKMYQNDLIETAGGVNVASDIEDTYWVDISYEQLVYYNPDYIVIAPEAKYSKEDVLVDENIAMVSAVKNNKVYEMPNGFEAWDSPVPSSILGKAWLTSILYENKYSYENFVNETYKFYKEFYDIEIDKEVLKIND